MGILASEIKQQVILTENNIQIKTFYILCCLNKNQIIDYSNISSFQVDIETTTNSEGKESKKNHIAYLDNSNKKEDLFAHNFALEEAEYFVYVANNFINQKKNMITMS